MRSHLGRVTHLASLDQYRRATLNAVSWHSGLKWPNDLEGQGRWPQFSWPNEIIARCILGTNLAILAQINYTLLRGQAKFLRILSRIGQNMAKMSLMVNVNDLNFQDQLRVSHGAHRCIYESAVYAVMCVYCFQNNSMRRDRSIVIWRAYLYWYYGVF